MQKLYVKAARGEQVVFHFAERSLYQKVDQMVVMVVMAALPVGINTYLFAERYECGQALAGTAVVLSTVVSVVTLSVALSMLA